MSKLVCPHCGSFTTFSPAQVTGDGILLDASSDTYTKWGKVRISAITPHGYRDTDEAYAILVCQGCTNYFIAKKEKYADDWQAVYPIQHKPVAKEIPEPIRSEFEEANLCFTIGAYKACLAICMVALESLWQQQDASGLNDLKTKEVISSRLFSRATEIRLWAGLVKHEFIHEIVTREETEELLTYLDEILHDVYVQPAHLAALAQKREQIKKSK